MKRVLTILILASIILINEIHAECDDKTKLEINTAASNVTVNLKMIKKVIDLEGNVHPEIDEQMAFITGSGYTRAMYVYLNAANINDKIYLRITSKDDNIDEVVDTSNSLDGSWEYQVPDVSEIRNYEIKIYSNVDSCANEELRTINIKSPMYNLYSESRLCENSDAYYCQEYITTPIDMDVVDLMWEKEETSKNKEEQNNAETNNKNIVFYIGTGIVIVLAISLIVIIIKVIIRKQQYKKFREIGL